MKHFKAFKGITIFCHFYWKAWLRKHILVSCLGNRSSESSKPIRAQAQEELCVCFICPPSSMCCGGRRRMRSYSHSMCLLYTSVRFIQMFSLYLEHENLDIIFTVGRESRLISLFSKSLCQFFFRSFTSSNIFYNWPRYQMTQVLLQLKRVQLHYYWHWLFKTHFWF